MEMAPRADGTLTFPFDQCPWLAKFLRIPARAHKRFLGPRQTLLKYNGTIPLRVRAGLSCSKLPRTIGQSKAVKVSVGQHGERTRFRLSILWSFQQVTSAPRVPDLADSPRMIEA